MANNNQLAFKRLCVSVNAWTYPFKTRVKWSLVTDNFEAELTDKEENVIDFTVSPKVSSANHSADEQL